MLIHLNLRDNRIAKLKFKNLPTDNTGCSKINSALSIFISIHYNIMMSQYRVPW